MYNDIQNELKHYGVLGMKWGKSRAQNYANKANISRESADEWREIGKNKADKYRAKGNDAKANKISSKYETNAKKDIGDAKKYDSKKKIEEGKNKFRGKVKNIYEARSTGSKVVTNILAGPFANRTYNSVIAAGGNRAGAAIMTGIAGMLGGPFGHIVISSMYTKGAAKGRTLKGG